VVASPIRSDPSSALATTEQGLSVKGSLGYELYCQAIRSYELAEYALPWWIGDLLNYGIEHFGDDAWAPVMERVGRRTAKNYADVCLAFPRGQRVPGANLGKHAAGQPSVSTYVKQARRRTDRGDERDSWGRKVIESPHRTVCPTCCCISYEETPTDD
jgi:hypothetical protein